ncbi:TetR/AcrR family transcriptional regulator [Bacillus sp. JJ722]|uniref:TetR/AcrR family transcriptional regulator n=1 Tax=Bacillus sp. JJ722 TaxID=3122973 RepID=UPI002FFF7A7A
MTANRIKAIALSHFARYGYEGTSLSNIANDVGIKKPSIYAHFKGKEDLYFACLEEALQKDIQYFQQYTNQNQLTPFEELLLKLLNSYSHRLKESEEAMFWLRTSYFPPDAFREQIVAIANQHIVTTGELLHPLFEKAGQTGILKDLEVEEALEAYLCLMDGLMVELIYAGFNRFEVRLAASWKVFWRGISQMKE